MTMRRQSAESHGLCFPDYQLTSSQRGLVTVDPQPSSKGAQLLPGHEIKLAWSGGRWPQGHRLLEAWHPSEERWAGADQGC